MEIDANTLAIILGAGASVIVLLLGFGWSKLKEWALASPTDLDDRIIATVEQSLEDINLDQVILDRLYDMFGPDAEDEPKEETPDGTIPPDLSGPS